ncbi:F-box family protein [Arabidopsis lyrata subsp. lyrata]|uniref:F-box family protein n=1 Tax=Arabidopsis lyrata subsp. lyrata TaxID=81972 RepID=D7L6Q6_ARALL|nr:F-box family protein [Arabidopsis lyrata subsp. lyrata]
MMFADLPSDLESEILSRVPATSLKELQTTCKRWYTLFRDPRFVKKNLVTEMNTLIHSINLRGIQNSFDSSIGVDVKLYELKDPEHDKIRCIISHCDGLLLCTTKDNNSRVVVWNPCTGQTRWIQSNMLMNTYSLAKFEIYEFNSDSWRILDEISPDCFRRSDGVTLKGNAYWFGSNLESKSILKFDFTTERFGRLSLPFQNNYRSVFLSVVREEKLALIQQRLDTDSLKMNIWVTKTKIDEDKDLSWSNFLVVDFGRFPLTSETLSYMSFLISHIEKKIRIYFAKEGIQVHQKIARKPKGCCPFLVSYVPSLVQIQ